MCIFASTKDSLKTNCPYMNMILLLLVFNLTWLLMEINNQVIVVQL